VLPSICFLFDQRHGAHQQPPSFPTRRSSDLWVVGHSYIIYAPLIAGMTTILYEGVPIRPDAGIWWKIVQDHKVDVMFSAPTAIRSEEHTSELQSRFDLVCRLLLEKKKHTQHT